MARRKKKAERTAALVKRKPFRVARRADKKAGRAPSAPSAPAADSDLSEVEPMTNHEPIDAPEPNLEAPAALDVANSAASFAPQSFNSASAADDEMQMSGGSADVPLDTGADPMVPFAGDESADYE